MPQENVEVVEAFYAAFALGDFASMLELFDPDVEWDTTARIDGRLTHGIEDMRASVQEGFSSFDRVRIEPQDMRQADGQVAVQLTGWFGGASSGIETEVRWAGVFALWRGRISSDRDYAGWGQALEAVGLRE
jgi:ketosteroid isomerase-like protein